MNPLVVLFCFLFHCLLSFAVVAHGNRHAIVIKYAQRTVSAISIFGAIIDSSSIESIEFMALFSRWMVMIYPMANTFFFLKKLYVRHKRDNKMVKLVFQIFTEYRTNMFFFWVRCNKLRVEIFSNTNILKQKKTLILSYC